MGTSLLSTAAQHASHVSREVSARTSNTPEHPVWLRLHTISAGTRSTEPAASPTAPANIQVHNKCALHHDDGSARRVRESISYRARYTAVSGASLSTLEAKPQYKFSKRLALPPGDSRAVDSSKGTDEALAAEKDVGNEYPPRCDKHRQKTSDAGLEKEVTHISHYMAQLRWTNRACRRVLTVSSGCSRTVAAADATKAEMPSRNKPAERPSAICICVVVRLAGRLAASLAQDDG
mmetsp:Transcript_6564/g.14330  ORF Transcript_6564/g.14330 Transcript_6564/m.14330 type:complete len:235 (-) Transcript_6564:244-948(-)